LASDPDAIGYMGTDTRANDIMGHRPDADNIMGRCAYACHALE
jgi:hypothetical protein